MRVRTHCTPASVPLVRGIACSARQSAGPRLRVGPATCMDALQGAGPGRVGCAYWGIEVRGDAPVADMA